MTIKISGMLVVGLWRRYMDTGFQGSVLDRIMTLFY